MQTVNVELGFLLVRPGGKVAIYFLQNNEYIRPITFKAHELFYLACTIGLHMSFMIHVVR